MEITAILNTHGNVEITKDTVDSILHYMTDRVLVVVDEANWHLFEDQEFEFHLLKGFYHNFYKAPYRNVVLGIATAARYWPDSDWFCYLEYDCLVGSSKFKKELELAEYKRVWCLGNDYRQKQTANLSYLEKIMNLKFEEIFYLLGACQFYHKDFIRKAQEEDFFSKFLFHTNSFKDSYFPFYQDHDLSEHLLPTLAKHWGGNVSQFARYFEHSGEWVGNWRRYPIRYRPELYKEEEFLNASIMHPLKSYNHPIRAYHRARRER